MPERMGGRVATGTDSEGIHDNPGRPQRLVVHQRGRVCARRNLPPKLPYGYAPDTNFFLQFKPPEDVPWSELANANDIELVVLAEVLGELDKHKNGGNADFRHPIHQESVVLVLSVPSSTALDG